MTIKKIDKTVLKETQYIASWVILLSVFMQAVFLVIGKWDITVLLGNILSGLTAIANFFFMGITVQKAVHKDEKGAKSTIQLSQSIRTIFLFVIAAVGAALPTFNVWTSLIPLLFPRVAIAFRPLFERR